LEHQLKYEEWFFQSDYDLETASIYEQTKTVQQWLKQQ